MRMKAPVAGVALIALTACTTINPYTGEQQTAKATKGAVIGAAAGALAGVISGSDSRERRQRALIGAGVGALAGGAIGYYMDVQEAELRQKLADTGVTVERQGNNIVLNMPGQLTFDVNRSEVKPQFANVLNSVATILNKNEKTLVEVVGHTDSTGSDAVNQPLSERRAAAVANELTGRGVLSTRIATLGMSSKYPIASNDTDAGRQANRRVEITLVPLTAPAS